MPHEWTRTLPECANYLNTTVCMLVHIHTHSALITDAVYTAPPVQDLNYPAQSYFP